MADARRMLAQVLAYAAFAAVVGYFADSPGHAPVPASMALLRLTFSHAGESLQPCRRYTPEEIARTAPNMRRALDCPRERVSLKLALDLDGEPLYHAELRPSGLSRDGASTVYEAFVVAPGPHRLDVRMRDTRREEGYDHVQHFELELAAGDSRVLDFRAGEGGFRLLPAGGKG
jgi:hypothetical protein